MVGSRVGRSAVPPPITPGALALPIQQVGSDACGSLPIVANPALPLLADGLLVHTAAFTAPQTTHVTLPAGILCDHCVLQVVLQRPRP